MNNIETHQNGDQLIITVDLSKTGKPSTTGKMQLLASSGGWQVVEQNHLKEEIKMNLTLGYKR